MLHCTKHHPLPSVLFIQSLSYDENIWCFNCMIVLEFNTTTLLHLCACRIASQGKTLVMELVHQHLLLIASSSTSHLSSPSFTSCHMNGCRVVCPAKQSCIIQESLCDCVCVCVWPHGSVLACFCQRGAYKMHRKKKNKNT